MLKDQSHPLVSIVIVSRNRPDLLDRAIRSVVEQNYYPLEIVLVDNASDLSLEPPLRIEETNIRLVRSDEVLNASASRNLGADHAKGEWIGFLDDDDYYLPGKISAQIQALQAEPDADFCLIDTQMNQQGQLSPQRLQRVDDYYRLFKFLPVHTNSPLIRAKVVQSERFNEELSKYTDLHFNFRVIMGYKGVKADGFGAVWMFDNRPDQISNNRRSTKWRDRKKNFRNWKIICDDFQDTIGQWPDVRKKYYMRLAKFALANFRIASAARYAARAHWGR